METPELMRLDGEARMTNDDGDGLTTEDLARALGLRENSILKRKSLTGSYFGLVPRQRENRRLVWPRDSLQRLLKKPSLSQSMRGK